MTRRRVYVSGPISNGGAVTDRAAIQEKIDAALTIANELVRLGYAPMVPHLTQWWEDAHPGLHDHATWLDMDFAWVEVSDAVYRMPGDSKGADDECRLALDKGIPIFHTVGALHSYFNDPRAEHLDGPCANATKLVYGDREGAYGHPYDDFSRTAAMWSAWKGVHFDPWEVAIFMEMVKQSRLKNSPFHGDSMDDVNGYGETYYRVVKEHLKRMQGMSPTSEVDRD